VRVVFKSGLIFRHCFFLRLRFIVAEHTLHTFFIPSGRKVGLVFHRQSFFDLMFFNSMIVDMGIASLWINVESYIHTVKQRQQTCQVKKSGATR